MSILSKNDQRGRSMVEMLGVLAIIGVLSVGGISGYSKAMAKFKLTKAQDQISMLLMNIRTAFATSPSYDGLNNGNAVAFAIAPGDMFKGTVDQSDTVSQLNNAFGGGAHVFACSETAKYSCSVGMGSTIAAVTGTQATQFFAIALDNLGREACVSLASSDWGTDGLVTMQVFDGANIHHFGSDRLPINMINAGTACPSYGKRGYIVWTYY
jgi:type II secretory pathway pseudopilin PulG